MTELLRRSFLYLAIESEVELPTLDSIAKYNNVRNIRLQNNRVSNLLGVSMGKHVYLASIQRKYMNSRYTTILHTARKQQRQDIGLTYGLPERGPVY